MSTDGIDHSLIASLWSSTCRSAEAHAITMSSLCSQPFADLIIREATKFTGQAPPRTADQLQCVQSQSLQLSGKISSVSHASSMARMRPDVAEAIHNAARQFCDEHPFTGDCATASMALSSHISALCNSSNTSRKVGG